MKCKLYRFEKNCKKKISKEFIKFEKKIFVDFEY